MTEKPELRDMELQQLQLLKQLVNGKQKQNWTHYFLTVLPVIAVFIGGTYTMGIKLGALESQVSDLIDFKNQGGRFTDADGKEIRSRLEKLEKWVAEAPPDWFEEQFKSLKEEVRNNVRETREALTDLTIEFKTFSARMEDEHQRMTHSHADKP